MRVAALAMEEVRAVVRGALLLVLAASASPRQDVLTATTTSPSASAVSVLRPVSIRSRESTNRRHRAQALGQIDKLL